jgi:RimJ/RimL family protein N-acetyltransferase
VPFSFRVEDIYPETSRALEKLHAMGYQLGAAGNMRAETESLLVRSGLPLQFTGSSERWGVSKPNLQFFENVIRYGGAAADRTAYVGDRLDNDILPAKAAGMLAVFVRRGPWGEGHSTRPESATADAAIETLAELPMVLEQMAVTRPRQERIGFRRMTEADLSLLGRWLAADHVAPWWGPAPAREALTAHYLPYIRREKAADPYLILINGAPVGYIQTFRIADWPSYWPPGKPYSAEPESAGIDLLIGEKDMVGRGLGTQVIQEFVRDIVFARPEVQACYTDPATDNLASRRAFRNAGFADLGPIDAPGDATPRSLLRLPREGHAIRTT